MNDVQEKYADKIAKLLAKAESTTPEEAEALTAKAQELMSKWAIDEAMVEAARGFDDAQKQIVHEEFVVVGIFRMPLVELLGWVLKANDLKYVLMPDNMERVVDGKRFKETRIRMATGFKSDMDRARMLFTSLMLQAIVAKDAWWRDNKHWAQYEKKGGHYEQRQFLFSFAESAGYRLAKAAMEARKAAEEEYNPDGEASTSVALVLADKAALVEKAFYDQWPSLGKARTRRFAGGSQAAASAGYEAGRRADIGQGGRLSGSKKQLHQ